MSGYTKLFGSLLTSSVWGEDNITRIVWITLLAMKNQHGVVEATPLGIAAMARVELAACEISLKKLSAPDPHSRSKEFEGRRVVEIEEGFLVVNHEKYRDKMSAEDRQQYMRDYMADYRKKAKGKVEA